MSIKLKNNLFLIVGFLILGLLLSGCGKSPEGAGPPKGGTPEVVVATMRSERVPLFTELPGRTSAYLVAEVRPQVNGIIQKRLFTEGADVKAGEMLYQIDPAPYEATLSGAKAALARAEANILSIRNRVQRYRELVAIKAVSQQDLDDAVASLKQAEAEIEANKAAVESAGINLAYTRITASISGRVGKSNITVGALATANQPTPLTVIQQLDPIFVDATQSSANLLQLRQNIASGRIKGDGPGRARVKLLLEDGSPYPQEGSLKFSDVTVDPSTGSYTLRMVFPNPGTILLPGMYVRALVQEGVVERAILAPQQGVSRDPKGNPLALIVDPEGKVQQRPITVDRAIGNKWLLSSGLKPGDRLIVEGAQKVRPGAVVKTIPFTAGGMEPSPTEKTTQPTAKVKERR